MSDTIRQQICDNLLTRLKTISVANGYSTNYLFIDEWKLTGLEPDQKPAIIMSDAQEDIRSFNEDKTDWVLHVTISIFVSGEESQTDLRNYIADVYKCIGADVLMDGLITKLEPQGSIISMQQEDDVYGDIDIKFDIQYSTKSWDLENLV